LLLSGLSLLPNIEVNSLSAFTVGIADFFAGLGEFAGAACADVCADEFAGVACADACADGAVGASCSVVFEGSVAA